MAFVIAEQKATEADVSQLEQLVAEMGLNITVSKRALSEID